MPKAGAAAGHHAGEIATWARQARPRKGRGTTRCCSRRKAGICGAGGHGSPLRKELHSAAGCVACPPFWSCPLAPMGLGIRSLSRSRGSISQDLAGLLS